MFKTGVARNNFYGVFFMEPACTKFSRVVGKLMEQGLIGIRKCNMWGLGDLLNVDGFLHELGSMKYPAESGPDFSSVAVGKEQGPMG
jgi:hypothetical protein